MISREYIRSCNLWITVAYMLSTSNSVFVFFRVSCGMVYNSSGGFKAVSVRLLWLEAVWNAIIIIDCH